MCHCSSPGRRAARLRVSFASLAPPLPARRPHPPSVRCPRPSRQEPDRPLALCDPPLASARSMCKVAQPASSMSFSVQAASAAAAAHQEHRAAASVSPLQGPSGTELTVWIPVDILPRPHALPPSVCIALGHLMQPTHAMTPTDARGWLSLVTLAPPHHSLHLTTSVAPVYVCLVDHRTAAAQTCWHVGNFTYLDLLPPHTTTSTTTAPRLLTQPWPRPVHNQAFRSTSASGPCSAIDHDEIHPSSDTAEAPTATNVAQHRPQQHASKKPRPHFGVTLQDYTPYPKLDYPANLHLIGDFHALARDWTLEELEACRRLVCFWREYNDDACLFTVRCGFKVLSSQDYHLRSHRKGVVVSCIAYGDSLFVTSVDIIHFLEHMLGCQFTIDEKNRVRRNLEGFHPVTASKHSEGGADLFRHIMGFTDPKPRNIEKDIKIFPWSILPYAAKKIIVKYFALQQELMLPTCSALPLQPVSVDSYD